MFCCFCKKSSLGVHPRAPRYVLWLLTVSSTPSALSSSALIHSDMGSVAHRTVRKDSPVSLTPLHRARALNQGERDRKLDYANCYLERKGGSGMRKGVAYSRTPAWALWRELARLGPKTKHIPQLQVSTQQVSLLISPLCWISPLSHSPSASGCC